jgi:hypothetical protein
LQFDCSRGFSGVLKLGLDDPFETDNFSAAAIICWNISMPAALDEENRREEYEPIREAYLRQPDSTAEADDWSSAEDWKAGDGIDLAGRSPRAVRSLSEYGCRITRF